MKRRLGTMLAAAVMLCASQAWSQSNDTGSSPTSSSSSSQSGTSGSSQSGSSSPSQSGSSSPSQTVFTSGGWTDPQNGSSDPTQSNGSGSDTTTQTGSTGPQDTFTHPEQLPALGAFSDAISHTGISISATAGTIAQYTSGGGYQGYWNTLNTFGGGISIAQYKANYGFLLNYSGGIDTTSGYSVNETELNQSAYAGFNWNFAKRWQLRVKDSYFYSNNPFTPFLTYVGTPTPNNPNPVAYYPQAIVEENTGNLDLTYQLSAHDLLDFNFGENFQRYIRGGGSPLWNSISYSQGAFYQHTQSAHLAYGGGYEFAALDFGHGQSRAGVQTLEGFVSYVFNAKVNFSLWIGPESTSTKDIIPVFCNQFGCFIQTLHQQSWSVAEGGTFEWKITPTDKLDFQGSRGVSNAGGILGAANIYQATLTYGRPINRAWTFGAALNYYNSVSISQFRAEQYLKGFTGTVGFTRRLFSDAWNLNAYYAFIKQSQNYFGLPGTASTNGLGLTIRYVWDHGFGG